jgi:arylsulfatase A-like enzyme
METHETNTPNIILIVIDALRARNLSCYGGKKTSTPHIDKMAHQGILFEKTYSCWNTTDQSLTTILSGRYPRTHGIIHHGDKVKPEDRKIFESLNVRMLAEILKPLGYKTMAVDWMGRWFKKGFDTYGYRTEKALWQKILYYTITLPYVHLKYVFAHFGLLKIYLKKRKKRKSAGSSFWKGLKDVLKTFRFTFELARVQDANIVTGVAEEWIKKSKQDKFFLFLHYWDTHTPYNCPRKFLGEKKIGPSSAKDLLAERYHGAVKYADHQLGRLFNRLREENLLDNTLVIITSDHGESLTEHDIFFDHHGLYEVTTHVPLILCHPRIFPEPKRIGALVQHVDLLPSLCDVFGIPYEHYQFDGTSFMPLIKGETQEIRPYVFSEESYVQRKICLRTKEHKFIFAPDGTGLCNYCQTVHGGAEELYDMETDPEEAENIVSNASSVAQQLRKQLDQIIKALDDKRQQGMNKSPSEGPLPGQNFDPKEEKKIKRKLRGLGYMD